MQGGGGIAELLFINVGVTQDWPLKKGVAVILGGLLMQHPAGVIIEITVFL